MSPKLMPSKTLVPWSPQVLEDRYQLQVSLRAAQKAQATAEAALKAATPDPGLAGAVKQLEGALRQATADYQVRPAGSGR